MKAARYAAYSLLPLLIAVMALGAPAAEKPLIGIATVRNNSPRALALAALLDENLSRLVERTGIFQAVNPALLREELQKFGCTDEQCLLGFARDAGLSLVIRGDLDDAGDFISLTLRAYGTGFPYQRQVVYRYSVRIPMTGQFGQVEYSNITGEHTGIFFSRLLARYQSAHTVTAVPDGAMKVARSLTGSFTLYRPDPAGDTNALRGYRPVGAARLSAGTIVKSDTPARPGDFILTGHEETARFVDKLTYEGKREVVFRAPSPLDTFYALLLTGPASAVMPILAPTLGYYRSNDWTGLTLWTLSVTPYLYLELNGFSNYYENYHKKKKTVPRDVQAQHYFGWYMLFAGGSSLFVDSMAHGMLDKAANYQGIQPYLGNALTAAYLSLISGGGGLFYRGDRLFGYLYYHADNLLMYFMIREFCPEKKFDPLTRTFSTGKINKTRAFSLMSVFCAVKIAEIIHAVLIRDAIGNGEVFDEGYSIEPVIYAGEQNDTGLGLQYSYRW
ncbi:MAG TPA: hypothetical protein PLM53_17245 [Spirochaetota bacterium]|nr:hypothetical protein [Spirochaetota bacterium]HPC42500.1 hypothetical protein [Spirochaetota bacterium]HPL16072.1 hypothetical protein [Spirochaetota bacterium]HQF10127.1 hypothetical protein [Spirochaetota bacterium]HQH98844.1 hypothetical protein [Spirochaetota bacterium]